MSFYRTLLAAVAAIAIASPVFADDTTATPGNTEATPALQVSENGQVTAGEENNTAATTEQTKVNINKATVKDLAKVKKLNPTKAKAIVAYRKKHGDFKSVDDLSNVKGFKKMKPDTMKEITDQLTVE